MDRVPLGSSSKGSGRSRARRVGGRFEIDQIRGRAGFGHSQKIDEVIQGVLNQMHTFKEADYAQGDDGTVWWLRTEPGKPDRSSSLRNK